MGQLLDMDALSVDDLWRLYEEIGQVLSVRLTREKRELEKRLAQLRREQERQETEPAVATGSRERRKYPRVYPKYRNPNEPSETWSGRGKQPRWLKAALQTGRSIEEFVISDPEPGGRGGVGRRH